MSASVSEPYKRLYNTYYGPAVDEKRRITALDSFDHIRNLVGDRHFGRVADVGAGEGSLLGVLDAAGFADSLYAFEISDTGIAAIKGLNLSRLDTCQSFDGYSIPFPDQFFDLVISMHVLEHVEHERLLLRELRRVGRQLVIEVPLEHGLRINRAIAIGDKYGHINFYTPPTFLNLLRTAGFRILSSRVSTSSLRYEQFCSGKPKGFVKHAIRAGLLRLAGRAAPSLMTYVLTVHCEPA